MRALNARTSIGHVCRDGRRASAPLSDRCTGEATPASEWLPDSSDTAISIRGTVVVVCRAMTGLGTLLRDRQVQTSPICLMVSAPNSTDTEMERRIRGVAID